MPEQTINIQATLIQPVQLKPECDILVVQQGRSSTIQYSVGKLIPGTPSVPEIPGKVGRGKIVDDKGNTVSPAIDGYPVTPAVPAVPDSFEIVDSGMVEMSDDEWNAFLTQDDSDYRTSVVAGRLGFTTTGKFTPVQ